MSRNVDVYGVTNLVGNVSQCKIPLLRIYGYEEVGNKAFTNLISVYLSEIVMGNFILLHTVLP